MMKEEDDEDIQLKVYFIFLHAICLINNLSWDTVTKNKVKR